MPNFNISSHRHSREEALKRMQSAFANKEDFGGVIANLTQEWNGHVGEFSGKVMGFPISMTLWVHAGEITISCKYPLAGLVFKTRMESEIREAVERILG